ncbi:MAG: thiamine-phosphate kinase [Hyphomicrobiaceae bacterium]|nr:thiamine-phosphate kinase [Hyphomicrobiaceae bacterium]
MSADDIILGEADIIGEFLAPLTAGDAGAFGLLDDCAALVPQPGHELVLTTDSLIEGVHFLSGDIPGFKALAVNVSDLVAKGATPRAYLMNLALPAQPTRGFMARLAAELAEAQSAFGCHLIGGDTDRTPGPFTITITAIGTIPAGRIVRRRGAKAGDAVVVTGTIGDAAMGLRLRTDCALSRHQRIAGAMMDQLIASFDRPKPHIAGVNLVIEFASAAMDISDGLAKDLERLVGVSGVSAAIGLDLVPLSQPAHAMLDAGLATRAQLVAGGEDYQILMTVAPDRIEAMHREAAKADVPVTVIGRIASGAGVTWHGADGAAVKIPETGWDHFAEP